jgi:hypothetical protein
LTDAPDIGLKYRILYPEKGFLANGKTKKKPINIEVLSRFRVSGSG